MAYIGKIPATQGKDAGPALKLDDISGDFDGLTKTFSLSVDGTSISPHVNNISVYLSGVYQIPGNSYSLSGSYIVFTGAPSSSLDFHGAILGSTRIIVPDNDTIETAAFTDNTRSAISGSFRTELSGSHVKLVGGGVSGSSTSLGSFGNVVSATHITASGNISASGTVFADNFESAGGNDTITFTDDLNITGSLEVQGDVTVSEYIYHKGDGDTHIRFADNLVNLVAGGKSAIKYEASTGKIIINNTNENVDFHVMAEDNSELLATDAANNRLGVNTTTPSEALDVIGNVSASGNLNVGGNITGSSVSASIGKFTSVDIDGGTIIADSFTGTFDGALSSSAQIAASISGSRDAASISGSRDAVSISGSLGANAGVIRTLSAATVSGSFGNQRVGTTDDVKFANITGSGNVSASGNLSITGNVDVDGTSNFAGNVTLQNDLTVTGRIDAEEIHTTFISSSIAQATGSNIFGDSVNDLHQFTGSIDVSGSGTVLKVSDGNVVVSDTLTATNIGAFTAAGAIDFSNENMTNVDIDSGNIDTVTFGSTVQSMISGSRDAASISGSRDAASISGSRDAASISGSFGNQRVGTTDDVKFANITGSGNISGSATGSFGYIQLGTEGNIDLNSQDVTIRNLVSNKDLIFIGNDGGTEVEAMRINYSGNNVGVGASSIGAKLHVKDNRSTTYSSTAEPAETMIVQNASGSDGTGANRFTSLSLQTGDGATSQGFINYVRTGDNNGKFTFTQRLGSSTYQEQLLLSGSAGAFGGAELLEMTYTNLQAYMPSNATGFVLASGASNSNARNWGLFTNYTDWGHLDFRVSSAKLGVAHTNLAMTINKDRNIIIGGYGAHETRVGQKFSLTAAGGTDRGGMTINNFLAGSNSALLDFNKSRNDTAGSHTVLQSGDAIGTIIFRGSDGDEFIDSAAIDASVDGDPANNDMPGRLSFFTTADGSNSLTERMRISNGGLVSIGDTANANMTTGLTINQGANDNEILAFKSSDIAHGVTATTETDTFARFSKAAPNDGGFRIDGYADTGTPGLELTGLSPSDTATRDTSASAVIILSAIKKNGTNPDDRDANKNIVVFRNRNTTRFIWNSDGDFYADVNSHTFDHYNDAQLARTFDLSQGRGVIQSKFDNFINYNHEKLAELELVGREKDGTPNTFVNVTGMQRLHNGAIWQQYTEIEKMKELMYDTMVQLLGKETADKKLEQHDIKLLDESLDVTDSLWSRTKNKVKSLFKVVKD